MTSLPQALEEHMLSTREQYLAAGWDTELFELWWDSLSSRDGMSLDDQRAGKLSRTQARFLAAYDAPAGTRAAFHQYRACLEGDLLVRKKLVEKFIEQQEDLEKQIDGLRLKAAALVAAGNRLVATAHLEAS